MNISSLFGSPDPSWLNPASSSGAAAGSGTAAASTTAAASSTGGSTAANKVAGSFQSLTADLQNWLTSLQASAASDPTGQATTEAASQNAQGATNTGDPNDTTAAANTMRHGMHHHHQGGGASATSTNGASSSTGSSTGTATGSVTGSTPATSQTGGTLSDRLAADVMRAMQAYGKTSANMPSGGVSVAG